MCFIEENEPKQNEKSRMICAKENGVIICNYVARISRTNVAHNFDIMILLYTREISILFEMICKYYIHSNTASYL